MSPEEVIGKFVSFELMIKDSKHIATWSKAPPLHCNTPGVTMARAHLGTKDCELYGVKA
jgi:hypothetical protein